MSFPKVEHRAKMIRAIRRQSVFNGGIWEGCTKAGEYVHQEGTAAAKALAGMSGRLFHMDGK
jgi:hypothetical protein